MLRLSCSARLFRGVSRKAVFSASLSTSPATHKGNGGSENNKIYEFRTYAIRPDKMGEYMKIMEENIQLRTAHSKMLGFWMTDLGGINEVNHLWEYGRDNTIVNSGAKLASSPDPPRFSACNIEKLGVA